METLSDLHDAIASINWFASAGEPTAIDLNCTRVQEFPEAQRRWNEPNFSEARNIAWEAFRGEICRRDKLQDEWIAEFEILNRLVRESVDRSKKAKSFIALTGCSLEDFCRDLPFVGAAGEFLIKDKFPEYAFFSSQLKYYFDGHWVCGWKGELRNDSFQYPAIQFYVF